VVVRATSCPSRQDVRIEVELNGRPAMTAHTGEHDLRPAGYNPVLS